MKTEEYFNEGTPFESMKPALSKGAVMRCPSKLILENRTDLPMVDFLRLAQEVVSMGRISNDDKQYCYLTAFTIDGKEYHIVSDLNEKSDKLTFYKRP
jgi:hypothetical protein